MSSHFGARVTVELPIQATQTAQAQQSAAAIGTGESIGASSTLTSTSSTTCENWEKEPNNFYYEATGPVPVEEPLYGYSNDLYDFFRFYSGALEEVVISLTQVTAAGVQIQMWPANQIGSGSVTPGALVGARTAKPYVFVADIEPETMYYIIVYTESDFNTDQPYILRVAAH